MGKKANPDASYLDIEKSFYKNKGKVVEIEELPFEVSMERKSSGKLDDPGLARPVPPAKGLQFKTDDNKVALEIKKPQRIERESNSNLGLVRPVPAKGLQFKPDDNKVAMEIKKPDRTGSEAGNVRKSSVPNVILRKPTVYKDDEDEDRNSRLRMRPNLSLKMRSGQVNERFSDMTLLRKPEQPIAENADTIQEPSSNLDDRGNNDSELKMRKEEPCDEVSNWTLLEQPHRPSGKKEEEQFGDEKVVVSSDVGAYLCCNVEFVSVKPRF